MLNYTLLDLISADTLQQIQDALEEYTGLSALVTDASLRPVTSGKDFSGLLKNLRSSTSSSKDGNSAAIEARFIRDMRSGKSVGVRDQNGNCGTASPIFAEDELIGLFVCAGSEGVSEEEVIKASGVFAKIAGVLSHMAYQNFLTLNNSQAMQKTAQSEADAISQTARTMRQTMQEWAQFVDDTLATEDVDVLKKNLKTLLTRGNELFTAVNDSVQNIQDKNGMAQLVETEYNLRHLIPPVIARVQHVCDQLPIVFSYNVDGSVPQYLFGDNNRIQQIVYHMFRGSTKHIQSGRVELEVLCQNVGYSSTIIFKYTDLSAGFDDEDLEGLQMFIETGDESYLEDTRVIGLGYRTLNRLVRQMFGSINFEIVSDTQIELLVKIPQLEVEVEELGS